MNKLPKNNFTKIKFVENESPVMILNSISRLFHDKARSMNVGENITQHSSRLILIELAHSEGLSQLDLVERTHLKAPTVSLALKNMEACGLVSRTSDERDMRVTRVNLTEKGRALDKSNLKKLKEIDEIIMKDISPSEIEVVTKILLKMRDNILNEEKNR